jgi:hypothetical protein
VLFRFMARKTSTIRSTRKQKGAAKPGAAEKEPATTPATTSSKKDDEGWGPIGDAAKKVAKGAVKGAAKEVLKK